MTTRYGRAILIALLSPCAETVQATSDVLLGQIRKQHDAHGLEVARGVAEEVDLLLREERGQIFVPAILIRNISGLANFKSRFSVSGARQDAVSCSCAHILVPLSRPDRFIDAFPEERLGAPFPAWAGITGFTKQL